MFNICHFFVISGWNEGFEPLCSTLCLCRESLYHDEKLQKEVRIIRCPRFIIIVSIPTPVCVKPGNSLPWFTKFRLCSISGPQYSQYIFWPKVCMAPLLLESAIICYGFMWQFIIFAWFDYKEKCQHSFRKEGVNLNESDQYLHLKISDDMDENQKSKIWTNNATASSCKFVFSNVILTRSVSGLFHFCMTVRKIDIVWFF
jgi:hypothetical protein